ncbi:unnamed protein product, partial [marine sediment metagenome]
MVAKKELAQQVIDMRSSVEEAKSKANRLIGERDAVLKQLDSEFD